MRFPASVSSRKAAWPSQVSVAMWLLCSPRFWREHRRTVRPESEANCSWDVERYPASSRCWLPSPTRAGRTASPSTRSSAAIPFTAVAALVSFGEHLEHREEPFGGLQALLWGLALALLVLSCAARSPATQMHTLPPLGASALVACLGVFALKLALAGAPYLRRLGLQTAKP